MQNNYTNSKIAQHTALKILSIVIYENSITRYCLTKHNKLSWVFVMQTPMCIAVALICLLCSLQKFLEILKIFANVFLWCLHLQCSKHLEYKIWTHSHNILWTSPFICKSTRVLNGDRQHSQSKHNVLNDLSKLLPSKSWEMKIFISIAAQKSSNIGPQYTRSINTHILHTLKCDD